MKAIVASAVALFRRYARVETELAAATAQLEERRIIERAKALLMAERRSTKPQAYRWLRNKAMNENRRIAQVAADLIREQEHRWALQMSDSRTRGGRPRITIGLLRLTNSAPVIVAHEFGFFADEGLTSPCRSSRPGRMSPTSSPMARSTPPSSSPRSPSRSRRPARPRPAADHSLCRQPRRGHDHSRGGLAESSGPGAEPGFAAALAEWLKRPAVNDPRVVHDYSTHNLVFATGWPRPGPSPTATTSLRHASRAHGRSPGAGKIVGFCVGGPGAKSPNARGRITVATSSDVWRNAPEKALAVRGRWSDAHPEALRSLLRALYRAARFCDAPANSTYVAALLSATPGSARQSRHPPSLPGALAVAQPTRFQPMPPPIRGARMRFGSWSVKRWGLIEKGLPLGAIAHASIGRTFTPSACARRRADPAPTGKRGRACGGLVAPRLARADRHGAEPLLRRRRVRPRSRPVGPAVFESVLSHSKGLRRPVKCYSLSLNFKGLTHER